MFNYCICLLFFFITSLCRCATSLARCRIVPAECVYFPGLTHI